MTFDLRDLLLIEYLHAVGDRYTVRDNNISQTFCKRPSILQLYRVVINPIGSGLFERTAGPGGGVGHHAFGPPKKDP